MALAWISLAALIVAITLSMVTSVNVGVVSLALAWLVGVYLGGMPLAKVIGNFWEDGRCVSCFRLAGCNSGEGGAERPRN